MSANSYPGLMRQIIEFLRFYHLDVYLHYKVPLAVMALIWICVLIGGMAWLCRKTPIRKYSEIFFNLLRGMVVAALVGTAVLAVFNYTDLCQWRYGSYLNAYEFYHYYMGSKYARELRSTELYNASLIADEETGLKYRNSKKSIRDLATGRYRAVEGVLKPEEKARVKGLFTDARWEEFVEDIRYFKRILTTGRWNGILRDKGYNASPVWSTFVGGFLSNQVPTSCETGMLCLALIDPLLIFLTFIAVCWAFGPRAALIMIALIGTQYMMKFSHMKGAYIRTDFATTLVLAACMLKKERYGFAGVLMAWSVLTRVFPAVFLFGIGALLLWRILPVLGEVLNKIHRRFFPKWSVKQFYTAFILFQLALGAAFGGAVYAAMNAAALNLEMRDILKIAAGVLALESLMLAPVALWGLWSGRIPMRYVRFFVVFFITIGILVASSIAYDGGLAMWKDYKEKIVRHNNDISPWRVGFKYLFITKFGKLEAAKKDIIPSGISRLRNTPLFNALYHTEGKKATPPAFLQWFNQTHPYTQSIYYKENPTVWWSIMAAMLIFCFFAVRGLKDHEALLFGFVPTFFMVSPTYYYYIMLIVPLLFLTPKLERPGYALGICWMFLTGMAGYYCYALWQQAFNTYFWMSAMVMILVLWLMLLTLFERKSILRGLLTLLISLPLVFYFFKIWPIYVDAHQNAAAYHVLISPALLEKAPFLAPDASWGQWAAIVVTVYGLLLALIQMPVKALRLPWKAAPAAPSMAMLGVDEGRVNAKPLPAPAPEESPENATAIDVTPENSAFVEDSPSVDASLEALDSAVIELPDEAAEAPENSGGGLELEDRPEENPEAPDAW